MKRYMLSHTEGLLATVRNRVHLCVGGAGLSVGERAGERSQRAGSGQVPQMSGGRRGLGIDPRGRGCGDPVEERRDLRPHAKVEQSAVVVVPAACHVQPPARHPATRQPPVGGPTPRGITACCKSPQRSVDVSAYLYRVDAYADHRICDFADPLISGRGRTARQARDILTPRPGWTPCRTPRRGHGTLGTALSAVLRTAPSKITAGNHKAVTGRDLP